ncbi:MAG: YibE/F family protein [Clostridia bacterium]|nr:YibE/F family protein [Clostridia bacterium]
MAGKLDSATKKAIIVKTIVGVVFFVGLIVLVVFLNYDRFTYEETGNHKTEYEKIKIIRIVEENVYPNEKYEDTIVGKQIVEIEILTGRYKGDVMTIESYSSPLNYNIIVDEGDVMYGRVYTVTDNEGKTSVSVNLYSHNRLAVLLGLTILFVALTIIIGGKRGLMSILGLAFTIMSIFFVLVPLVLRGFYAIPTTIAILTISTIVCFFLLGGWQTKIISAVLGTVGGVVISGLLATIAGNLCRISGNNMDEAESLYLYADNYINVKGLFISGILIAAVGAIMDVAMSISSSIDELYTIDPTLTSRQLFKSGMNIGRDAMGTMTNTLILAFAGSYLNIIIFVYQINANANYIFNDSNIAIEVITGIGGSVGIIATVPLVAFISSILTVKIKGRKNNRISSAKRGDK